MFKTYQNKVLIQIMIRISRTESRQNQNKAHFPMGLSATLVIRLIGLWLVIASHRLFHDISNLPA